MNSCFFIADLHLGHKKAAQWRGFSSIEQHDEYIINSCNSVLKKKDTLWVLGDVAFNKEALALLNEIRGYKKIILGNHDKYPAQEYLKYANNVFGVVKYKNYILSHIPVHPCQFQRYKGNIHGHLHNNKLRDTKYFCVSCENVNYKPVTFEELERGKYE